MNPDSIATVKRVAELARIAMDERELSAMAAQFEHILAHFEVLSRLDVESVDAMGGAVDGEDVLRADEPEPGLSADEALANAPERIDDFYAVPKTVGGDE